MADQVLTKGHVTHVIMGVSIGDITPEIAQRFNLSATRGALVAGILEGSPADRAGLKEGDVITRVDGAQVSGSGDVRRQILPLNVEEWPSGTKDILIQVRPTGIVALTTPKAHKH